MVEVRQKELAITLSEGPKNWYAVRVLGQTQWWSLNPKAFKKLAWPTVTMGV